MKILDDGHIYQLDNVGLNKGSQNIKFRKRSGGAIQYEKEWDGLSTQEVLRMAIKRTIYLNNIISCMESDNAIWHLRMALWEYEARAWRRKNDKVNRHKDDHLTETRNRPWRTLIAEDVPFGIESYFIDGIEISCYIEDMAIGDDGHINTSCISMNCLKKDISNQP